MAWANPEISWDFTADQSVPLAANEFLDDEDIAVLVGCNDADTLPRLEASKTLGEMSIST